MDHNLDNLLKDLGVPIIPETQSELNRRAKVAELMAKPETKAMLAPIHNPSPPHHVIQEEKPEHTIALWMKASGKSNQEIATHMGWSIHSVYILCKQPWFRAKLERIIEENGKDMVQEFLKGEVKPSLEVLVEIRDNPKEKGSTRIAAAREILDRGLGKSTVRIETKQMPSVTDSTAEVEQLRRESEELAKKLSAKGVNVGSS